MTASPTSSDGGGASGAAGTFARKLVRSTTIAFFALLVFAHPAAAAVPPNDDFDAAVPVTSVPYTNVQDVTGATLAADDPPACRPLYGSVWYAFAAPASEWVAIETAGSTYESVVSVWQGERGALTDVTCRAGNGPGTTRARFLAEAGETYHVAIAHSFGHAPGTLSLHLRAAPPPQNDDFDQARTIPALPFVDELDMTDAGASADDPSQCWTGTTPKATVWYAYTASSATTIDANTLGSTFTNALSVWTGSRGALDLVACSLTSGMHGVRFAASPGTTYYFMVDAAYYVPGLLVFTIPRRTSLGLGLSKSTVPFGRRVTLTARLDPAAAAANPTVSIYSLVGSRETLVKTGPVDENGVLRVAVRASRSLRFVARWTGGQGWLPAESATVRLGVRTIVRATIAGHHGKPGAYHLFRVGSALKQTCTVRPRHGGKSVVFAAERLGSGGWRRYATGKFKLSRTSSATAYLAPAPGRYRVRCSLPRHFDHDLGTSPWLYARFG